MRVHTFTRRFLHCAHPFRDFFEPSCVIFRRVQQEVASHRGWQCSRRVKLLFDALGLLLDVVVFWVCKFRGAGDGGQIAGDETQAQHERHERLSQRA